MQTSSILCRFLYSRTTACSPVFSQVRWSRYSQDYIPPTLDRDELSQPLESSDARRFKPIKAAVPEETTSVNYDPLLQKFIRMGMKEGNKILMTDIMARTYANIKIMQLEKYHQAETEAEKQAIDLSPTVIFHKAVNNCKPRLETFKVKKGGITYQVPSPCSEKRQTFISMKWLIETSNDKDFRVRFHERLAKELIQASANEGKSVRKKQEMHRLCEANKAYAHFRWVK